MAGVDQPVEQRFGDDGVREQRVPVDRLAVGGQDQRAVVHGPIGDQFVEVVGLGGGVLAQGEVVEDQDGRAGVFADAGAPGAVGVAAGEVGQDPAGLGEPDLAAAAGDEVPECLCHMGFAYSDGSVEDDRFAGAEPAQGGQVADLRGGDLRVGGEVEAFQGDLFLEAGAADPAGQRGGLPAADLVLAVKKLSTRPTFRGGADDNRTD